MLEENSYFFLEKINQKTFARGGRWAGPRQGQEEEKVFCCPGQGACFFKTRRAFLAIYLVLIGACILGLAPRAVADSAMDTRGLRTPAIRVQSPATTILIGITNAGHRLVAFGVHGVIIYSDDNGQTWMQAAVPVDVSITCAAFANGQDGWAAGHDGAILHTTDGGATWQLQLDGNGANQLVMQAAQAAVAHNDPSPGTPRAIMRANHFLQGGPENPFLSILVTDPRTAFVFGAYRIVMKTADAGKTWTDWSLHIGDPISHNLYNVATVGQNIYVAGEAGSVFRSTDGGMSFPAVATPADITMFVVLPTGDGGVFVCGVAGHAFRSADHGQTWQPVNFGTQNNLIAAVTLASGGILVGSEAGTLYIGFDHAKTFLTLPDALPMEIFGLTQAANGDVVAVGSGGVIVVPAKDFDKS
jgi:photosystem II stability/assembly factor-like uncharacterized protein